MKIITDNITHLGSLCKKYKVKALYAFGSVLTNRFNDNSDIDFVVDFNEADVEDSFVNFFDFQEELETLFGRRIDLVDYESITNVIFKEEVNRTRQLIYG